ncbi:MAG: 6-bladed beta-propeller [Longimicrobiales bacterium]
MAELGDVNDPRSAQVMSNTTVHRLSDGRFLVFQRSPYVLVYDSVGRYVGHIGRQGEGPGEFKAPWSLAVDASDSIWVAEFGGKVTVLGPDGVAGRVLPTRSAMIPQIQGFTPSGRPVVLQAPRYGGLLEVWSRDGSLEWTLGVEAADTTGRSSVNVVAPQLVVMLEDTVALVRSIAGGHRIERWTPGTVDTVLRSGDIGRAYQERFIDAPVEPDNVYVSSLTPGADGAVWGLAGEVVFDLSQLPVAPGQEGVAVTLENRNLQWDGLLWRWDPADGTITVMEKIPQLPSGFVDGRHFFSFREDEFGLLIVQVWRAANLCKRAARGASTPTLS